MTTLVVLVTGVSRGAGRAVALEFGAVGAMAPLADMAPLCTRRSET